MSAPPSDGDPRRIPGLTEISGAIFEQQAAVVAGLQCKYIDDSGEQKTAVLTGRETVGHTSKVVKLAERIPDGSIVMFGADVMFDGDPWLNKWFIVNSSSSATAHFKLVGALLNTTFLLKEIV